MKLQFRFSLSIVVLVLILGGTDSLAAQTLNDQLMQENPETLVRDATEKGDIVRGAILYHQGNINCAECHRPQNGQNPLGPDLSDLGDDATGPHIVESILQPSKVIREGYETVVVLTVGGQTFSGIVVEETEQTVSLRDGSRLDAPITLARNELDEIRPGKISNMPANLVNELEDRQQFLDLLKYVLDLKDQAVTGVDSSEEPALIRRELSPELEGLILVKRNNCIACHPAHNGLPLAGITGAAPRLSWSARWLNPEYLEAYIADPHAVHPSPRMPDLFGEMAPETRRRHARSLTQFLLSKSTNEFRPESIDRQAVASGRAIYHEAGCVACHGPRNEAGQQQPLDGAALLGDLTAKYNVTALTRFLEDPLHARPAGYMPKVELTHREAINVSNYLLQVNERPNTNSQPVVLEPEAVRQGRQLFLKWNCARCHSDVMDPAETATAESIPGLPLEKLDLGRGCLSRNPQPPAIPNFELTDQQRMQIRQALQAMPLDLTPEQSIRVTLQAFRCSVCHQRGDFGGVRPENNPHFQTTDLNLGEQGKIPPTLTRVGAKLQRDWMRDVLVHGRSIRPYMKARMPQYGEDNIGHLVDLFQQVDRLPPLPHIPIDDLKETRDLGLHLVGNQGLNCVACHTYKFKQSDTMPAVDLTEMASRLKKEWFHEYMLAPQSFSPNTVMPSYWPGGQAIRPDLPGSPQNQIEAIWHYLVDGRQARPPRGVIHEPLEIVVGDQAKLLRRKYPGIGKRGIGVGYPGGINIAFDAEQMRLGLLWKGKFVDPGGVWRGQGSGNVRPLGHPIEFPQGPDIDGLDSPWQVDEGRPPNHQFQGYSLDEKRRPTFHYNVNQITVRDSFRESIAKDGNVTLRRIIKVHAADQGAVLRWRLAAAKNIQPLNDHKFAVGERLELRLPKDAQPIILDNETESAETEGIETERIGTEGIGTEGVATEGVATEGTETEDNSGGQRLILRLVVEPNQTVRLETSYILK